MNVAFGFKAHSGWAVLVVLAELDHQLIIVDRRRVELVEQQWAKQPYHAAEHLPANEARELVKKGVEAARTMAVQELRIALMREQKRGNKVTCCSVLVGSDMPEWSIDEILAVHFRMHKAEGVLFRDALARAAKKCRLKVVAIREKELDQHAREVLGTKSAAIVQRIGSLGKSIGPPWGKDQKDATVAAVIGLRTTPSN